MQLLISAGEASGEAYGAQLIAALRQLAPDATFFGMGGEQMQAAGCELLVNASQVAVVGLVEVVKHLPDIRRQFRKIVDQAARRKPDAAVLIDFPDFNLRLARELHHLKIPVFYFVSPQLWAWRPGRVEQIKKYVRQMIVIFPFEQEFYRKHGVEVTYVGHPLAHAPAPQMAHADFARRYGLRPNKQWIALLPGSRRKEVMLNLPVMIKAAEMLSQESAGFEFLLPVASTLRADWLRAQLSGTQLKVVLTENAGTTLFHARAAVVASGTATVEAALAGVPFVVVYRLAPLTWLLGRRLVKLDTFAMPNLIAGGLTGTRKIVPELVQSTFTPENVVRELRKIVADGPARQEMMTALKEVQLKLKDPNSPDSPALRAARLIIAGLN